MIRINAFVLLHLCIILVIAGGIDSVPTKDIEEKINIVPESLASFNDEVNSTILIGSPKIRSLNNHLSTPKTSQVFM